MRAYEGRPRNPLAAIAGVARALYPAIADLDFAAYPESAQLIADYYANGEPLAADGEGASDSRDSNEVRLASDSEVEPPERIAGRNPQYPEGQLAAGKAEAVVVECIIGSDGIVRRPAVVNGSPLLVLDALESLRTWRFKPARWKGAPVAVYYNLTVNYRIRGGGS